MSKRKATFSRFFSQMFLRGAGVAIYTFDDDAEHVMCRLENQNGRGIAPPITLSVERLDALQGNAAGRLEQLIEICLPAEGGAL